MAELTRLHMEVLEFERARWGSPGRREAAIRTRFGWSTTRHAQVVDHLLDQPAAAAYDPQLVGRLRDLRAARARGRSSRARRDGFSLEEAVR